MIRRLYVKRCFEQILGRMDETYNPNRLTHKWIEIATSTIVPRNLDVLHCFISISAFRLSTQFSFYFLPQNIWLIDMHYV